MKFLLGRAADIALNAAIVSIALLLWAFVGAMITMGVLTSIV